MSESEKIAGISQHLSAVLKILGIETNESTAQTPDRVARMWVKETFKGLDPQAYPQISTFPNHMKYTEPVHVGGINIMSTCEHHFQPIYGQASVAYLPEKKIIGLSKINRLVDYYCRRPQVQERLTMDIYKALSQHLETENIAVSIKAIHFCVVARGVKDLNSWTATTQMGGIFKSSESLKSQFLAQAQGTLALNFSGK